MGIKTLTEFEHIKRRKKHIPGRGKCTPRILVFLVFPEFKQNRNSIATIKLGPKGTDSQS